MTEPNAGANSGQSPTPGDSPIPKEGQQHGQPTVSEDANTQTGGQDLNDNPRFQEIITQKNKAKKEVESLQEEIRQLRETQKSADPEKKNDSGLSEAGEKFLTIAEQRILGKIRESSEAQAKEERAIAEAEREMVQTFRDKHFSGDPAPEGFIDHLGQLMSSFGVTQISSQFLEGALQDFKARGLDASNKPDIVADPSKKGGAEKNKDAIVIDPNEDFVTAARRKLTEVKNN
jgi:hypothetical protein